MHKIQDGGQQVGTQFKISKCISVSFSRRLSPFYFSFVQSYRQISFQVSLDQGRVCKLFSVTRKQPTFKMNQISSVKNYAMMRLEPLVMFSKVLQLYAVGVSSPFDFPTPRSSSFLSARQCNISFLNLANLAKFIGLTKISWLNFDMKEAALLFKVFTYRNKNKFLGQPGSAIAEKSLSFAMLPKLFFPGFAEFFSLSPGFHCHLT